MHELYIHGIQDMRTGCQKTFDGVEALRDGATDPDIRQMTEGGLNSMRQAMDMFDEILGRHGAEKVETGNKALKSLGEEASEWVSGDYANAALKDLAIIEKTRNIAAYPDAGFEAFANQADALGYDEDAKALRGQYGPSMSREERDKKMAEVEQRLLQEAI
ncbi:DUF892 family protein [Aurantiacibacter gangjinensis]|uniref:DUF892 family protein n=1 Tax=Aurantiacibacter gangjinensis TaxID=502682 RepID=UPI0009E4FF7D|nr:DUF892 family protein [Aurantiacibacter gangjinensis]